MKIEQIVSNDEIQTPRKTVDFLGWVKALLERIDDANPNDDDEELESQINMRTGIAKTIYEEVFPLFSLLKKKREAWSSVLVRNVIGNQPFDVEIIKEGQDLPDIPDRLEITYAIDGKDYKLRMEHLQKHGWTSMTGPVTFKKDAGEKEIHLEPEAKLAEETVSKVSSLIKNAIQKKLSKNYQDGTGLILYVEDYGTFRSEKYLNLLCDEINNIKKELKNAFRSVYLILSSNEKVVEW